MRGYRHLGNNAKNNRASFLEWAPRAVMDVVLPTSKDDLRKQQQLEEENGLLHSSSSSKNCCNCNDAPHGPGVVPPSSPSTMPSAPPANPPSGYSQNPERKAVFWCHKEGVYFTFTKQEIKIKMCRVFLQILMVCLFFLAYFIFWEVCDLCIFLVAAASCGGSCIGLTFLSPSCWAGIFASLLRGFRIGSEIAHVDVHWKI